MEEIILHDGKTKNTDLSPMKQILISIFYLIGYVV